MAPTTAGFPTNGLSVLAIDEDKHHADYIMAVLPQYKFHVTVYTNPIRALNFLKDHAQDVDFLLVAVNMQEIPGFQFLDIVLKMYRNIQVIMMSTITTMDLMKRCIELDARFLVKKPIDSVTICSLWQHLDLGPRKMEMIHNLIQDPTSETHGAQSTITDLSDDADSMNISSSKVQSSIGSNTVNIRLVNYSDSEDGETAEKNPDEDLGSETSPSPNN